MTFCTFQGNATQYTGDMDKFITSGVKFPEDFAHQK